MKTDTKILIESLRILARDIESGDGVANACIAEAAERLEELTKPEWYYAEDGDISGDWDTCADHAELRPGGILQLHGARVVDVAFVANVPIPDEDDGQYKLFATKEEAKQAIVKAAEVA